MTIRSMRLTWIFMLTNSVFNVCEDFDGKENSTVCTLCTMSINFKYNYLNHKEITNINIYLLNLKKTVITCLMI